MKRTSPPPIYRPYGSTWIAYGAWIAAVVMIAATVLKLV